MLLLIHAASLDIWIRAARIASVVRRAAAHVSARPDRNPMYCFTSSSFRAASAAPPLPDYSCAILFSCCEYAFGAVWCRAAQLEPPRGPFVAYLGSIAVERMGKHLYRD